MMHLKSWPKRISRGNMIHQNLWPLVLLCWFLIPGQAYPSSDRLLRILSFAWLPHNLSPITINNVSVK